jgi:hypothetical protein
MVVVALVVLMRVFVVRFGAHRQAKVCRFRRRGMEGTRLRFAFMRMAVIIIVMHVIVLMMIVVTFMARFRCVMLIAIDVIGVNVAFVAMSVRFMFLVVVIVRLFGVGRIGARGVNNGALHAIALAAAARIAVTGATPVGAVFAFLLGFAMGTLIGFDQRLTIRDRDLIIVGMDFAEGEEAVPVAAIFDEGGLQGRLYARNFGEVDVAAQLLALGSLEIKFFNAIAADHNDPGLFRVGGVDQHFVGHFGTLGGGGRVWRRARMARPGDATVHLIRG